MPQTCLLLLAPTTTGPSLVSRITKVHPSAATSSMTHATAWSLTHCLYRNAPTPSSAPNSQTLQVLNLSNRAEGTFVHTVTAGSDDSTSSTTVCVAPHSSNPLQSLLTTKLNALWSPARNYDLQIPTGTAFQVGIFQVAVGNVVAARSAAGPAGLRGCALKVTLEGGVVLAGPQGKRLIQEFVQGVVESTNVVVEEYWGDEEIQLWCEVMRNKALSGVQRKAWDVLDVWTKSVPVEV